MRSVSVIIATYNRCSVVKDAIESVLAQDYPNLKCIVVDDCSEDNTCEQVSKEYRGKVELYRMEQNSGPSACRNFGAQKAMTDYITFLDSDDLLYKNAVSLRMSLLEELRDSEKIIPFGIMKTPGKRWQIAAEKMKREKLLTPSEYIANRGWCNNNGFIVQKDLFLKIGSYNTQLRDKEDFELILRLMTVCEFRCAGKLIGEVRDICAGARQRENYENIIAQRNSFTDAIRNNKELMSLLGEKNFLRLLQEENENLLRALYYNRNYQQYRENFHKLFKSNLIRKKRSFLKRYLLSFLMQFIKQKY